MTRLRKQQVRPPPGRGWSLLAAPHQAATIKLPPIKLRRIIAVTPNAETFTTSAAAIRPAFGTRLRAATGRWFAYRQTVCDLTRLKDEDIAHLGITANDIRNIARRRAVSAAPLPKEPRKLVASVRDHARSAPPLAGNPLSLLTSAAVRR